MWVVLLVQTTAQGESSGQNEISFESFCIEFDGLRSTSSSGLPALLVDLGQLKLALEEKGIISENYTINDAIKRCAIDPSKYFDPECVYSFYVDIVNEFLSPSLDAVRNDNMLEIYLDIWQLHPLLRRCLSLLNKDLKSNDAKSRLAKGLSEARGGSNPFVDVLYGKRAKFLRKEIQKLCENEPGDRIFCSSLPDLVKLVDVYEAVKDERETSAKWRAYLLHYVMLKHNYPEEFEEVYPTTAEQVSQLIVRNSEEVFTKIVNGQISELKDDLLPTMPDLETIKSGCTTSWKLPNNVKKNECMFWQAIIQVKAYFQSKVPSKSGKETKILNTNIDYPAFLRLTEMDRILTVVQNQETALQGLTQWLNVELSKTINERFIDLRTYFQKVETFNREKANADIGYINGRLAKYASSIDSLSKQLGRAVGELIDYAIAAVSLELAEDTAQLILAGAVLLNPLEKLFGGSSAGDYIDRQAKVAHTLTRVGELLRKSKTFNELVTKTQSISTRFNKNANFLENVRLLVDGIKQETSTDDFETLKQTFLHKYKDYNPQVEKRELSAMVTTWENMIDETCDVIMGTETNLAAVTVALVRSQGLCPKAKVLAREMISTYEEVYDFQFELIETMATSMRATTAQYAALRIAADYSELSSVTSGDETVINSKTVSLLSYIIYKTNIWQITEAYCDILEYKEGGIRPNVCQGPETEIASLASHVSPVCRNLEENKDVPITSSVDKAFMRLSDLFSGKPVNFKIPNSQWLVNNGWVDAEDQNAAIVVKKFVVFLPTEDPAERSVRVEAKITGWNQHSPPSGTSYVIASVPEKKFIFQYRQGRSVQCRKESDTLNNPYGPSLPKICPLNVDDNNCQELLEKTSLFPSVYSQWQVSVNGYESLQIPDPATGFKLKAGVKLCVLDLPSNDKGKKSKDRGKKIRLLPKKNSKKFSKATSCPNGQYWSVGSNGCVSCPIGSRSALNGYYCEKIPKQD